MPHVIRNARDAEEAARLHLEGLGAHGTVLTASGPDGGVDVRGPRVVAQVKAQVTPVSAAVVQQIFGIARVEDKTAAVYALAGFTPDAVRFADKAAVALFQFDLVGEPQPLNHAARTLPSKLDPVGLQWKHPVSGVPLAASISDDEVIVLTDQRLLVITTLGDLLQDERISLSDECDVSRLFCGPSHIWTSDWTDTDSTTFDGHPYPYYDGARRSVTVPARQAKVLSCSADGQEMWIAGESEIFYLRDDVIRNALRRPSPFYAVEKRGDTGGDLAIRERCGDHARLTLLEGAALTEYWEVELPPTRQGNSDFVWKCDLIDKYFSIYPLYPVPFDTGVSLLDLEKGDVVWSKSLDSPVLGCLGCHETFIKESGYIVVLTSESVVVLRLSDGVEHGRLTGDPATALAEYWGVIMLDNPARSEARILSRVGGGFEVLPLDANQILDSADVIRVPHFGKVLGVGAGEIRWYSLSEPDLD